MKAAVLSEVDAPLTIEDVTIDEPGPSEVVLRVAAAGLCHSDVRFMEGSYHTPLPAVLGHESACVVERVGDAVTRLAPGDHVITSLSVFCGSCHFCASGRPHLCDDREATRRLDGEPPRLSMAGRPVNQFLDLSSFAERMLVHENAAVKITERIPLDRAALLGCGVATGLGAVLNTAAVEPGQAVAVIGCGGVGLAAVQGARIAGADPIVAVDRVPERLQLAAAFGATHGVDARAEDPRERVMEITGGRGVDHALEAIGTSATVELAFAMAGKGGTATAIGLIPVGDQVVIDGLELLDEKRLQGCAMGSNDFHADVPRYIEMYLDGRLNLDDMVSDRIGLDDINEGFDRMRAGHGARTVVVLD